MKKNMFIKGTILLFIGSVLARIIGMIIRIVFTRIIGEDGISLLNIIMPTYVLVINLTSLGLPLAISIITSKNIYRGKNIILSTYPFVLLINTLIMISLILSSEFIADVLLKTKEVKNLIVSLALTLPFISISSILRGYYLGKQKMFIVSLSSIIEQVIRLMLIFLILPLLHLKPIVYQVSIYILFNIISESITIFLFILSAPKNFKIESKDLIPDLEIADKVASYCTPAIGSKIISNIIYFFEPIILMHILTYTGYTSKFIRDEYGIYNAYSLSLLLIPSFLITSLNTSLIPEVSKKSKNTAFVKKRLYESINITLLLSLVFNIVIFLFPKNFLKLLYATSKGAEYIKVLAPFFILFNLTGPMTAVLNGLGEVKKVFNISLISSITKTILMVIFSLLLPALSGFILSEIVSILLSFFLLFNRLKQKQLL